MTYPNLQLTRTDLDQLRDDDTLRQEVEDQLRQLRSSEHDAHEQFTHRLTDVDQALGRVRGHLAAVDPDTAKSLGLYDQAKQLTEERAAIEEQLSTMHPQPELPPLPELRVRIAAEFDRLDEVLASGTLEERRNLVGCYVDQIKTKPEEETVCIGLFSGLSQMVEQTRRWSSLLSVRRAFRLVVRLRNADTTTSLRTPH